MSPIYFGVQNMKLGAGKGSAGVQLGANYTKVYKKAKYENIIDKENMIVKETPVPPITSGQVRQRYKKFGEAYDNQEIVHPSVFGQMLVPTARFNSELLSPVYFGYMLFKKPVMKSAGDDKDDKSKIKIGLDGVEEKPECLLCYVGKPGCPLCWDFPEDFTFSDYAYEGPMKQAQQKEEEEKGSDSDSDSDEKPEIHTNLTTMSALKLWRGVNEYWVTVYVKTVPCGSIVKVRLEKNWTVGHLYEMFRSNSNYGHLRDCFLFLPTENGVYSLDNEDLPETDTLNALETGLVPLKSYSLSTNNSTVCLLHFQFFSEMTTCINIKGYLDQNLNLKTPPKTNIIPFVDTVPKNLPGDDQVQAQLTKLISLTMEQDTRIRKEDLDADQEAIGNQIMERVAQEKEKLLVKRRIVAEELRVIREAERDVRTKERKKEEKKAFKLILKKEAEEEAARKQKEVEEDRKLVNSAGKVLGGLMGGLKRLPSLGVLGRRQSSFLGGPSNGDKTKPGTLSISTSTSTSTPTTSKPFTPSTPSSILGLLSPKSTKFKKPTTTIPTLPLT